MCSSDDVICKSYINYFSGLSRFHKQITNARKFDVRVFCIKVKMNTLMVFNKDQENDVGLLVKCSLLNS